MARAELWEVGTEELDWDWQKDWWEGYSRQRRGYLEGASKIWGWKLSPEERFPALRGIKKFAKLIQGPGKDVVVSFRETDEAPAYYDFRNKVVVISYGERWQRALQNDWWAEAMAAHEIGHVRFTPALNSFPIFNLAEDRRIEESMIRLFPKLREKFVKVFKYVLSEFYGKELKEAGELLYPAIVSFHYAGALPEKESVERATGKRIEVKEVNGYSLSEFLKDLYSLFKEAMELVGINDDNLLLSFYKHCSNFQKKYFPTPESILKGIAVQDKELSFNEGLSLRERHEKTKRLYSGNSPEVIDEAICLELLVNEEKVPRVNRGVLKKFLSFFPAAMKGRSYAEEGVRLDMRRYVRGYEDVFVAPQKTPAPYYIDVVIDGSGSMTDIEDIWKEDQESYSYVRKVIRLLQEAEKVSRLRFRVFLTLTCISDVLFIKREYEGQWLPTAFRFLPTGGEGFTKAVPHIKSRTVLIITDGDWNQRSLETVRELSRKKAVLGVYIQGEHGYSWEEVKENVENFHRFLYLKDEGDLWKIGKELARLV